MHIKALMNGRVATALFMFLVFATMSLLALGYPEKARFMPLLVGVPGTLLGLAQLVLEIRASAKERAAGELAASGSAERQMFGWILLFFAGLLGFGFVYAAPLLVFCFLLLGKKESLTVSLASAAGTWVLLFGVFEQGLELPLFTGLVVEWLAG